MRKPDLADPRSSLRPSSSQQVELADECVDDPATVDFHQLQAMQLHVLRGSPEDLREAAYTSRQ